MIDLRGTPVDKRVWFDTADVLNILSAAEILTDEGKPWTLRECRIWMQAAGEKHQGLQMVRRDKLHDVFPDAFEKLGLGREARKREGKSVDR